MRLEQINIQGKAYYGLAIPYDKALIIKAKHLEGKWHPSLKLWLFKHSPAIRIALTHQFAIGENVSKTKTRSQVPPTYLDQLERRR